MCRAVANRPYTGLKKALAHGQHRGHTMASRRKRDYLTLAIGAESSTAALQLGKCNQATTNLMQFVPSQELRINRKKKQPAPPKPEINESWMHEEPLVPVQRSDKELRYTAENELAHGFGVFRWKKKGYGFLSYHCHIPFRHCLT